MQSKNLSIECTINLHKKLLGAKFKNRASKAVIEIKKFAKQLFSVNEIRMDTNLNKQIWENGPRHVPFRIRVRMTKHRYICKKNVDREFVFIFLVKYNKFKNLHSQIY